MEWIEVSIETENQGVDVIAQVFYEVGFKALLFRILLIFPPSWKMQHGSKQMTPCWIKQARK